MISVIFVIIRISQAFTSSTLHSQIARNSLLFSWSQEFSTKITGWSSSGLGTSGHTSFFIGSEYCHSTVVFGSTFFFETFFLSKAYPPQTRRSGSNWSIKIRIKIKKVQGIRSSCGIYSVKHNPIFTRYPLPSSHFTP